MSATLDKGFQPAFGTSPKEIYDFEERIKGCQEKLEYAFSASIKVPSKYWSEGDLNSFKGAKWTPAGHQELLKLSDVWIRSLVDKEHMFRLPELTAYLALHYPQVNDCTKPALMILDLTFQSGTAERTGFSDCQLSDFATSEAVPTFGKNTTDADYVRFRCWYEGLSEYLRIAFVSYLALGFVQLCNKTVEEVQTYMRNHAMHDFQKFWGVPANNLTWIPSRSLTYLKSYFQPSSQLLVTVLRPFLNLREKLLNDSTHEELLESLDGVIFAPTKGLGLELVQCLTEVVQMYDLAHDQLLADMPEDTLNSTKRLQEFICKYGLSVVGTCYWARHFSAEYFAEFQIPQNKKAVNLLSTLLGYSNIDDLEDAEKNWVVLMRSKYSTRKEISDTACFEGFWDGARRLDYA